jgi:hypothetical protein
MTVSPRCVESAGRERAHEKEILWLFDHKIADGCEVREPLVHVFLFEGNLAVENELEALDRFCSKI